MNSKFFFSGKELQAFPTVYEPKEDSQLLAETIPAGIHGKALDLGCGTGIQTINLLEKGANHVTASDVNLNAVANAKQNLETLGLQNKASLIESDLFSAFSGKKFDVIVFNPPYLPSEEIRDSAVDGGKLGRLFLDKFLREAPGHLNPDGVIYFLHSSLNDEKLTQRFLKELGYSHKVLARKKMFFEEIQVIEARLKA